MQFQNKSTLFYKLSFLLVIVLFIWSSEGLPSVVAKDAGPPVPLISDIKPVDWWFVFKFNSKSFEGCGERSCIFGGNVEDYGERYSQQYVYASSDGLTLQKGDGCLGDTFTDPVGATFNQVYNGDYYYVLWNDQFYGNPIANKGAPYGHSKGMLAWDDDGNGFVMQVSTPSWPGSGSAKHPRQNDGNTLGCIEDDDVEVSQHFFALKLTKDDLIAVLQALQNARVVTDTSKSEICNNGGPEDVQEEVAKLGIKPESTSVTMVALSSGIQLISKPYDLEVPPWQLVSEQMGGVSLRIATWWDYPSIPSTTADTKIECWDDGLGTPGAVEIATSGQWDGTVFGLRGGPGTDYNHAKIGVSTDPAKPYTIFGDMNQQGALYPGEDYSTQKCSSSQNGRGGTFYVIQNKELTNSITSLINGETAPTIQNE